MNKIFLSVILALPVQLYAAQTIDTSIYSSSPVGPFGQPDTSVYGQTITTDAIGGRLESFSFYLRPLNEEFKAYVFAWDGFKATGTALYESSVTNIGTAFSEYQEVTFSPNVNLSAGSSYVLFFSTAGLFDGSANVNSWELVGDHYLGGDFVFTNAGNDFSKITSTEWDYTGSPAVGDLAFKAVITSVPEPSAWSLSLLGLTLLGLGSKMRKTRYVY